MTMNNAIAKVISIICFLWMLCFALFVGSSDGKAWYKTLSAHFFHTDNKDEIKGGVLLLALAFPVLVAGTAASLLTVRQQSPRSDGHSFSASILSKILLGRFLSAWFLPAWKSRMLRLQPSEPNWTRQAILFLLMPSTVYLALATQRHLYGKSDSLLSNSAFMHVGNSFGVMAFIAGSVLLIPVTKQSTLAALWGWNPISFSIIHIWCGRIFVIGSILHGIFHIARWKWFLHESIMYMLFPPLQCWSNHDDANEFKPTCQDEDTDCTCYHLFRNFTGFMAVFAMTILLVTSVGPIRRASYALFYSCHVTAAPLAFLFTFLHYNKAVVYLAPSILYYLATTVPVWIEMCARTVLRRQALPLAISSAKIIPSSQGQPCVSLTVEASEIAWQTYYAGAFVRLTVPQISWMSHPFTINRVEELDMPAAPVPVGFSDEDDEGGIVDNGDAHAPQRRYLRIVFRAHGPFTNQLQSLCTDPERLPAMYMDGYHGGSHRLHQVLSHGTAVFIAGGIGITPYLSLLHDLADESSDGIALSDASQKIVLHWMCRDSTLIDYIRKEYFETLQTKMNGANGGDSPLRLISINIYNTSVNGDNSAEEVLAYSGFRDGITAEAADANETATVAERNSAPFTPSHFSTGSGDSIRQNLFPFLSFLLIGWLGLWIIWKYYLDVQQSHEVTQRVYSSITVSIFSIGVSYILYRVAECYNPYTMNISLKGLDANFRYGNIVVETNGIDRHLSSENLEMTTLHQDHSEEDVPDDEEVRIARDAVSIQQERGRPSMETLLRNVREAEERPGLFYCIPPSLSETIQQNLGRDKISVSVYAEAFSI